MAKKIIPLTRRQFLMGAAGVTLALPVLPSLLLRNAYGADPVFVRKPRLYWLTTHHGGAHENSMFPSEALLTQSEQLFADHAVRMGALRGTVEGATRGVSAVLRADASKLTEQMLGRINVLRGIDVPF